MWVCKICPLSTWYESLSPQESQVPLCVYWDETAQGTYDVVYVMMSWVITWHHNRWSRWLEHGRMWESWWQVSGQGYLSMWPPQHIWSVRGTYTLPPIRYSVHIEAGVIKAYNSSIIKCMLYLSLCRILILYLVNLALWATLVPQNAFVSASNYYPYTQYLWPD